MSTEITYRYERKFLVDEMDAHRVRGLIRLHPAMFVQAYPPRYVNNIYLDTPEMDCYYENIGGVMERRKVRVRWYGALFGSVMKPVLEFKTKRGFVGAKETYPLTPFTLDQKFTRSGFQGIIAQSELPQVIRYIMRELDPVLVNRYFRWYYASLDGRFRLTVDTELVYYNVRRLNNPFLYHQTDYQNVIVELKYDARHDPDASRVAQRFPFPLTKNSKYVQGIERVYV